MKISVVSPCHKNDIYCLPDFFSDLGKQSRLPDEVVVYIQPIDTVEFNPYDYISKDVDVKIITSTEPSIMGYNKNRAIENSTGDILCLMDIDDRIHRDKLKIVENFFSLYSSTDILVHSFKMNDSSVLDRVYDLEVVDSRDMIYISSDSYKVSSPSYPLHCAHSSIKRSVWTETPFREDRKYYRKDDNQFLLDNYLIGKTIKTIDYTLINFIK